MNTEAIIQSLPIWSGRARVERIDEGRTNDNFRVTDDQGVFFARVGRDLPRHRISRDVEARSARHAATLGIAPAVRYAEGGILVTDFIQGRTWRQDESRTDEGLARLARTLRRLHDAESPSIPAFDPAQVCRFYLDRLPSTALAPDERRIAERILEETPETAATAFIHADVIPENVIDDGVRLWLVDWEYAGTGSPATDLAVVASNFDLGRDQCDRMVELHGATSIGAVAELRPALALREALWTLMELEIGGARGDLLEYRDLCLRRVGIER